MLVAILRRHRSDIAWAAGCAVFTSLAAAWSLRLWQADIHVPFTYSGDALAALAGMKSVLVNGWYQVNPYLGAPFGLELYDYPAPAGDHLHVLLIKAMVVFSSNPAVAVNTYYLMSFPMSAISAFAVQRHYGISRPVAFVTAVLFAWTPDHFLRGESHLFLSVAWSIPLACYLVIESFAGRALIAKRSQPGRLVFAYASKRTFATLIICVVMATTGTYYAMFTVVLVAVGSLMAAIGGKKISPLVSGAVVVGAISATLVANLAPTLIYHAKHGSNPAVGHRLPLESDIYGLKLVDMLLPVTNHRVPPLARIREKYDTTRVPTQNLYISEMGTAASIGFLFMLFALMVTVVRPARAPGRPLLRHATAASLAAVLLGTIGGFGTIIAYTLSPQFRAWARISIVIVFLSLIGLAILLETVRRYLVRRSYGRPVWFLALPAFLIVAMLDTNNPPPVIPTYASNKAMYASDSLFMSKIAQTVGPDATIFQLPYMSYPETGPVVNMQAYEPFRAYIHSDTLHWSYAAMRGRPTDWASQLNSTPVGQLVPAVAAAGFKGIWVDRNGYEDRGARIEAQLARIAGHSRLTSPDGTFAFINLRNYIRAMRANHSRDEIAAARAATLYPASISFDQGFFPTVQVGKSEWHWGRAQATAELQNRASRSQRVVLSAVVATGTQTPYAVVVRWPGGYSQTVRASSSGTRIRRVLVLKPGSTELVIATSAPRVPNDSRDVHVAIIDPVLRNPAFAFGER